MEYMLPWYLLPDNHKIMIAYIKGVVKSVDKKGFTDKLGTTVEYNEVYLQTKDEDGFTDTGKLNTKQDLTKYMDEPVTLKVNARQEGKLWKLSIIEAVPE